MKYDQWFLLPVNASKYLGKQYYVSLACLSKNVASLPSPTKCLKSLGGAKETQPPISTWTHHITGYYFLLSQPCVLWNLISYFHWSYLIWLSFFFPKLFRRLVGSLIHQHCCLIIEMVKKCSGRIPTSYGRRCTYLCSVLVNTSLNAAPFLQARDLLISK